VAIISGNIRGSRTVLAAHTTGKQDRHATNHAVSNSNALCGTICQGGKQRLAPPLIRDITAATTVLIRLIRSTQQFDRAFVEFIWL
jgi:hypothetical protein